jgi:hypothetical protein
MKNGRRHSERLDAWPLSIHLTIAFAITVSLAGGCSRQLETPELPGPFRDRARLIDAKQAGIGRLVPNVEVVDIKGRTTRLADRLGSNGLLIAMMDTECPVSRKYAPRLATMERPFAQQGIPMLYLNCSSYNTPQSIVAAVRTHGLTGDYVHATNAALARALQPSTTAEVFLLDSARTLVYRGAVDDQHGIGFTKPAPEHLFLRDAIEALLANRPLSVAATAAPGCVLKNQQTLAGNVFSSPTYYNEISRLIMKRCHICHYPGGEAPFALESYEQVAGRLPMVRYVLENRIMPPWFASPDSGPWRDDRSLTEDERNMLLSWIDAGAPDGDPRDAPIVPLRPREWRIGTPDVEYALSEPQAIPAEGVLPYVFEFISTDFKRDMWIQAMQIRPTAPESVHHVLIFLDDGENPSFTLRGAIDTTSLGRSRLPRALDSYLTAFAQGQNHIEFPEGTAKRLPKGATLVFQIHYVANGTATNDQTRLGIAFADGPPDVRVETSAAATRDFVIPAGADNYAVHAVHKLKQSVHLLAFFPHMHYRGKAFSYNIDFPGGHSTNILMVPRYDFYWQPRYELQTPLFCPRGTRIDVTGWFDNSTNNPAVPNPHREVRFGLQSTNEMMIGYFDWLTKAE